MKHTWSVTVVLVVIFLSAQFIGLLVTRHYLIVPELPLNIERPEFDEETSFIPLFILILISTGIALLLARFSVEWVWKVWFFLSIVFCVTIALAAFMPQLFAFIFSLFFAFFKVIKRNLIIHNVGELIIYGGLAAIFVPILSIFSISVLLLIISLYDYIAVRKTEHMIKLAKFQAKLRLFAGVLIPYGNGTAILGGGDIGFPLLFAGVVMKSFGFKALIVSVFATLSLLFLFWMSEKRKFYPAMPFITAGCFLGYAVLRLIY
ncbi:MAG: presenilin family intramembrane aspartyl protease [Nanoarchaeota archaeon]|nr:presenilin family intramembrane aspartyl protease [Nanoarchaeota archaeon]